ncbi:MAG: FKBP-type peptidylprolyl isomerase [Flavobacterium sp.]|nr:FKBP-type peptidylprolyl isomerase [Flavobacterium sp.]
MNKFKFYFILLITTITIFSCSKNDDSATVEPLRDFQTQYNTEIKIIEDYLKTNYITVKNAPGQTSDQDVVISKITDAATQPSIMSYKSNDYAGSTVFPQLKSKIVKLHNIEYTLYYLVLREGKKDAVTGLGGVSPCNVDGVLTSYKGTYLSESTATTPSTITATQFEEAVLPSDFFSLFSTITGWGETFPQFKTGSYTSNSNGTITYTDFGSGVMFLPSGLAYYASGSFAIPAYSPLVFSFKLYDIQRLDQDSDGIPSYLEDASPADGYMRILATGVDNPDDTDKDGIPDFYDVDDDGDNYTTKLEIKNPATGLPYPFANIPTCTSGKKIHLDGTPTCHP